MHTVHKECDSNLKSIQVQHYELGDMRRSTALNFVYNFLFGRQIKGMAEIFFNLRLHQGHGFDNVLINVPYGGHALRPSQNVTTMEPTKFKTELRRL